ncbi:Mammalian cell entry related domain protein [Verrucomicrobia bacterium]|nr:Mammalian cell entry related domain protein [Verrucomicrobiota bacterium]
MALQDLTPQLRTRLSRVERAVGWFIVLTIAALLFGFGYYIHTAAQHKGWFLTKAPYFTMLKSATGLNVGDPVTLMGFNAGEITVVKPMPADDFGQNVFVEFELKSPNYAYMWTEGSVAKITSAGLLGKRGIEVTRGTNGYPTYVSYPLREVSLTDAQNLPELSKWRLGQEIYQLPGTNLLAGAFTPLSLTNLAEFSAAGYTNIVVLKVTEEGKGLTGVWRRRQGKHRQGIYERYTNGVSKCWLFADEPPAVAEQAQALIDQVRTALPNFLSLTNQLNTVLSNSANLTSNLNLVALSARPVVSNLAAATADLNHPGALGDWLLPTNINEKLADTLGTANTTLASANTNLEALFNDLGQSLENLANITSNLNNQVQANTNMLSSISGLVVHTDEFVQGLKRFWLLRHLFKSKTTNAPPAPARPLEPLRSPKSGA